jgi:DNA-binding MarR family transcriptional regulator
VLRVSPGNAESRDACLDIQCSNTYYHRMASGLRDEIRQTKPFTSLQQEAELSVLRTAGLLLDSMEQLLRPFDINPTQYNALRILRGAGEQGLCRDELRSRLVTRMADATRLLDRLADVGLVTRARDTKDRRLVTSRITGKGLRLLEELEGLVAEEHQRRMGHLSEAQLKALIELTRLVRQAGIDSQEGATR